MLIIESSEWPGCPSLRIDGEGSIRIGFSRVTIDVVLADYRNGMSAEEIVSELDTLSVADVRSAIAYCLSHSGEINEYLRKRKELYATKH